jgi:tRNA A37 methylthiotransferase MiaB
MAGHEAETGDGRPPIGRAEAVDGPQEGGDVGPAVEGDAPAEKRRRLNALLTLQEAIGQERLRRFEGRPAEVLVESIRSPRTLHDHDAPAGEGPSAAALGAGPSGLSEGAVPLAGRNHQNRLVHLRGPAGLVGQLVNVRVERAGPYALVAAPMSR